MSQDHAKLLVERLKSDSILCQHAKGFVQDSMCRWTLSEIRRSQREAFAHSGNEQCTPSSNYGKAGLCPYSSKPHGYEYWVG